MDDYLKLKAELLVEGIMVDVGCLTGLGKDYKEQNHGLFGWDFEDHPETLLPDDFCLPDGTVVQFRLRLQSPYRVKIVEDSLILFYLGEKICKVMWIKRPGFYNRTTSQNIEMIKIGQIGGEDCLFFCYLNYCSCFGRHKQCIFCNLVATSKTYNSVLKKKDIDTIGEISSAAWEEDIVNHVLLTGGCLNYEKEVYSVTSIIESIKEHTGFERIHGTILPSPAKNDDIQRYFNAGIKAIGYSMEIWDESLYCAICPGNSEYTSHQEFVNLIEQAVKIFGPGNVYGVFVMGLEPRDTFLEGVSVLYGMGANIVPFVWSPNPGSRLYGHRAPESQWDMDVINEAAEIVAKSGVPAGT